MEISSISYSKSMLSQFSSMKKWSEGRLPFVVQLLRDCLPMQGMQVCLIPDLGTKIHMSLGIESRHAATGKPSRCNKHLVQPKTNKQAKNHKKGMLISKLSMNLLIGKYCCKFKTKQRTKLVEVMEFQLSSFKSWKMMLWKCCTQYAANLENSAVATGPEKVSFHSNPKETQCQRMFKLLHNCTHLTC